jgi:hypothetical protein
MSLNQEEIEILERLARDECTSPGYGTPGEITRRLVDEGYVALEHKGEYWYGRLTPRGHRAIR